MKDQCVSAAESQAVGPIASHFVDTAPREEPSEIRAKPVVRRDALAAQLSGSNASVDLILEIVCRRFTVTRDDILGIDRHQSIAHARQVAAWLIRRKGLSYPEIGRALRRDHTTIIYAVQRVQKIFDGDEGVRESLLQLEAASTRSGQAMAMGATSGPTSSSGSNVRSDHE